MLITLERRSVHCFGRPCSEACLDQFVNFPLDGLNIYTYRKHLLVSVKHTSFFILDIVKEEQPNKKYRFTKIELR